AESGPTIAAVKRFSARRAVAGVLVGVRTITATIVHALRLRVLAPQPSGRSASEYQRWCAAQRQGEQRGRPAPGDDGRGPSRQVHVHRPGPSTPEEKSEKILSGVGCYVCDGYVGPLRCAAVLGTGQRCYRGAGHRGSHMAALLAVLMLLAGCA